MTVIRRSLLFTTIYYKNFNFSQIYKKKLSQLGGIIISSMPVRGLSVHYLTTIKQGPRHTNNNESIEQHENSEQTNIIGKYNTIQ